MFISYNFKINIEDKNSVKPQKKQTNVCKNKVEIVERQTKKQIKSTEYVSLILRSISKHVTLTSIKAVKFIICASALPWRLLLVEE